MSRRAPVGTTLLLLHTDNETVFRPAFPDGLSNGNAFDWSVYAA
jgi:hypothetical protein